MEGGGVLILASAADLQALVGVFLPQQSLPGNQPGKGCNCRCWAVEEDGEIGTVEDQERGSQEISPQS